MKNKLNEIDRRKLNAIPEEGSLRQPVSSRFLQSKPPSKKKKGNSIDVLSKSKSLSRPAKSP